MLLSQRQPACLVKPIALTFRGFIGEPADTTPMNSTNGLLVACASSLMLYSGRLALSSNIQLITVLSTCYRRLGPEKAPFSFHPRAGRCQYASVEGHTFFMNIFNLRKLKSAIINFLGVIKFFYK